MIEDAVRAQLRRMQFGPVDLARLRHEVAWWTRAAAEEVPGHLMRLPDGDRLFERYIAAVKKQLRRQEREFNQWAQMAGIVPLKRDFADDGEHDPTAGYEPGFDPSDVNEVERAVYEAAGGRALVQLGIPDDFVITSKAIQDRVEQLFLDQIKGIDETTKAGLRQILIDGGGKTIAELAQDIADYWDERTLAGSITIAATEMARASYMAELDTYLNNGVEYARIAGGFSGDICDQYVDQVYKIEDAYGIVPIHPNCTHYAEPVVMEDYKIPGQPWTGQDLQDFLEDLNIDDVA